MVFSVNGFTNFSTFIIWINLLGALLSVLTAIWASKKLPAVMAPIVIPIGILAGIYSVAYVVLLSNLVEFTTWSAVMRGVSIMAWFIVWVYPWWKIATLYQALLTKQAQSLQAMHDLTKALEQKIDRKVVPV